MVAVMRLCLGKTNSKLPKLKFKKQKPATRQNKDKYKRYF